MKQKYPFIKVKLKHRISTKITHEQMAFILMLLWLRYAEINRASQHSPHLSAPEDFPFWFSSDTELSFPALLQHMSVWIHTHAIFTVSDLYRLPQNES